MKNILIIKNLLMQYDKKGMIMLLLGRIVKGIMPGVLALVLAELINCIIKTKYQDAIICAVLYCSCMFLVWMTRETQNRDGIRMKARIRIGLQRENLNKINRVHLELLEKPSVQDLKQRVFDDGENHIVTGYVCILELMEEVISILILAFLVGQYHALVGLFIILMDFPIIMLAYRNGKKTYQENKEATLHRRYYSYLGKVLLSKEYVDERKIYDNYDFFHNKWEEEFEKSRKLEMHNFLKYFLSIRAASILEILVMILLLASMGKVLWKTNAPLFVALSGNMISLLQIQTENLPFCVSEYAKVVAFLEDRQEFLNLEEKGNRTSPEGDLRKSFRIELHNVRFRYPGADHYAIDGVNLTLSAEKHYAFVGKNGSGKTTLARLLLGMYKNYEGSILIDGNEVRECSDEYLRNVFSVVFQDFAKYPLTVKENIQMGCWRKEMEDHDIDDILRTIELYDAVGRMPDKWDTLLWKKGEKYAELSRGQWQRLAIGRSLYSDAPIKILDEPTASIDPVQERSFFEQYREICRAFGTILISHRLASVKYAESIILLDHGMVREQGSHAQLMNQKGAYYQMYKNQEQWYVSESEFSMENCI